jgi:hypothetical protein
MMLAAICVAQSESKTVVTGLATWIAKNGQKYEQKAAPTQVFHKFCFRVGKQDKST